MPNKLIGGVFKDTDAAERAIRELKNKGYAKDDFSVFAKDKDDAKEIGKETNTDVSKDSSGRGKNAGKGAGIGIGSGGVLGGVTGLLLEVGLLAIPGIGAVAAAGPLAATLAGAGVGATGGGLVGALTGAGIPEEHAKEYEEHLKKGNIIVLVEEKDNAHDVYETFMNNDTQNANMYPQDNIDTYNRNNPNNQYSNQSAGIGGAMRGNSNNNSDGNFNDRNSRESTGANNNINNPNDRTNQSQGETPKRTINPDHEGDDRRNH